MVIDFVMLTAVILTVSIITFIVKISTYNLEGFDHFTFFLILIFIIINIVLLN